MNARYRADEEESRRIAACLKACEGIPTEKLEEGVILRLAAACVHVDDDEVRAALDDLTPNRRGNGSLVPIRRPRERV